MSSESATNPVRKMFFGPTDQAELNDHRKKVFGFGIAVLLLAGFSIFAGSMANSRISQTSEWPSTYGRIIASEEDTATSRAGRVITTSRIAKIEYEYTVKGQKHTCDSQRVIPMFHFSENTDDVLAKYRRGMSVTVYYDPANPDDALLQNEPSESAVDLVNLIFYGGLFCGFIGLVVAGSSCSAFFSTGPSQVAATQVAAAPVSTGALPSSGHPAPPVQAPPVARTKRKPKRWPMAIRILMAIVGAPIALLGVLLVLHSATSPANPEHDAIVNIISMLVMAGIAAVGGYLIWLAVTKNGKSRMPAV